MSAQIDQARGGFEAAVIATVDGGRVGPLVRIFPFFSHPAANARRGHRPYILHRKPFPSRVNPVLQTRRKAPTMVS